jgi:hypothetical protein
VDWLPLFSRYILPTAGAGGVLLAPWLSIDTVGPRCTEDVIYPDGSKGREFRVRVRNRGFSTARNCYVTLDRLTWNGSPVFGESSPLQVCDVDTFERQHMPRGHSSYFNFIGAFESQPEVVRIHSQLGHKMANSLAPGLVCAEFTAHADFTLRRHVAAFFLHDGWSSQFIPSAIT